MPRVNLNIKYTPHPSPELDKLKEIFYDINTGLSSMVNLIRESKRANLKISNSEIKDWYKRQPINQVFSVSKNTSNIPIHADYVGDLKADLIDITNLSRSNDNMNWILTVIDTKTRYAWAVQIKSKHVRTVFNAFKPIYNEVMETIQHINKHDERQPLEINLTTDMGNEFKGEFRDLIKNRCIASSSDNTKGRMYIIESFNRTLLSSLFKVLKLKKTSRYLDYIDSIMNAYNRRQHSALGISPFQYT